LSKTALIIKFLSPIITISGARNWTITPVSGSRNIADPFSLFLAPEIVIFCQFLGPEIVKMSQHISGPRNWHYGSVMGPEIVIMVQFLVQIFVSWTQANRKRKINLNRFWIIDEFNRNKKIPFKQKFSPFYEFLGPETDIMVQFLDPETDVMVQFLAQK
jgi:hypothetical protein